MTCDYTMASQFQDFYGDYSSSDDDDQYTSSGDDDQHDDINSKSVNGNEGNSSPTSRTNEQFSLSQSPPKDTNDVYQIVALATMKGDRPYNCDICGSSFVEKRSVYRHISIVHKKTVQVVGPDGTVITTMVGGKSVPHSVISSVSPSNNLKASYQSDVVNKNVNGNEKGAHDKRVSFKDEPSFQLLPQTNGKKPFGYCIPYRCLFEDCTSQFPNKESMVNHMMEAHQRILMLEKVSPAIVNKQVGVQLKLIGSNGTENNSIKSGSKFPKLEKPFVCPELGCFSSYTRSTRLKEHIRKHHSNDSTYNCSSSSSGNGSILKVKLTLPKTLPLTSLLSSSSDTSIFTSNDRTKGNRETIHPKKYHCDFPGCDKVYTKSSHVKRHKDSVHSFSLEPICQITEDESEIISNELTFDDPQNEPETKKQKVESSVFVCKYCEKHFTRKSDLSRHINAKHSV